MNIYYIEVENFKSFRGKHQIGPFTQMTGIIGPNGCGKSNIVDALTFAFNIENARNHHPISSITQQSKPDICSVEVVLHDKRQKVSFKKTQSRKKQITFYMNNNILNQEQYLEQLRKYNIGPQSFMLQGETDKLIKKSPEELSEIIEKACGSIQFKKEYDELNQQIKSINDETIKIISEQKNLKKEDQKLRSISEQNEKYESLNEEIKQIEVKIEQANFFQIDSSILQEMKALSSTQNKLDKRKTEEGAIKQKIQQNNIKIKNLQKEQTKKEKEREQIKQQIRELQEQLEQEEDQVKNAKSFSENAKLQKSFQDQIKEINDSLAKLNGQLRKEESILSDMQSKESQKSKIENKKLKDHYEEYQELVRICNSQTLNLELESKKLANDMNNVFSQLKVSIEAQTKQNNHIEELETKINEAKTNQISKQGELQSKQQEISSIKQELVELENQRKDNVIKMEHIQKDLSVFLQNKLSLEYELEQMEEIRNQNKVYRELHKFKGFYGQFSELIRNNSNKSYDLPIKIALGSFLSCLVVDSPQTASLVNVTLASQGLARDVMILQNLPNLDDDLVKARIGNLGELATSLVDIDERSSKYEENPELKAKIGDTLKYLLRGKVICENTEKAFQLRNRKIKEVYQMITKDGDIVTSGSIQISSSDKEKYSKKDLGTEQNIQNLQKKIQNEEKQIDKKMAELESIKNSDTEKKYNKLLEQLQASEASIQITNTELSSVQEKIKKLEEKKQQIRNVIAKSLEIINLENTVKEIEKRLQETQEKIDKKRNEVYDPFCKKYKIEIKELISVNAETVERIFKNIEKQQMKVQDINNSIKSNQEKLDNVIKAQEKYSENKKNFEELLEQFKNISSKIQNTKNELDSKYKKAISEVQQVENQIQEINQENESSYQLLIQQPNQLRKDIIQIKHSIGQLIDKKETLWQECQLKQIEFKDSSKMNNKVQKDSMMEEQDDKSKSQSSQQDDIESQDEKEEIQTLSKEFTKSLKQYTQVLSQINDAKLHESLNKFCEIEMLNYFMLFKDKSSFQKKRTVRQQQMADETNDSLLTQLLDSVDIGSLLNYQNRLVDRLEELRKKIEEYASKDLAEGLMGAIVTSEEMKVKKENLKNRQAELVAEKKKAEEDLKNIKKLRKEKFDEFFKEVQSQVKIYYGELTKLKGKHQGQKGNADLTVSDEEEKYKGGINYFCCPPKKAYALNPEKELSGGEKTLAQIALFLAIAKDSPFLILDESEAALDSSNTLNVIETFRNLITRQQKLIVSHNQEVYSQCDSLIGTTFNRYTDTSFTLSLNLKV
ncbi:hypothetical protein ABPG72_000738 [Tetrahymena utriculariae]